MYIYIILVYYTTQNPMQVYFSAYLLIVIPI